MSACCCIGAQNGAPLCPCRMKNVVIRDGRYVEETDLGPVGSTMETYPFNLDIEPLSGKGIASIVDKALSGFKPLK